VEFIRKLTLSLRRNAKEERVLFHFNGHGVPRPTDAGEIWLFNKNITQYIPLSLYDLQSWMGSPSVYVWDCPSAGTIIKMLTKFTEQQISRAQTNADVSSDARTTDDTIQLGACRAGELL
jgi:regulator-associated protein of mTOR